MKKFFVFAASLYLAACSSSLPNLVHSNTPILNINATLSPLIKAKADTENAWVQNISSESLQVDYHLFWYDQNGVTQITAQGNEAISQNLLLAPQQRADIPLVKPSKLAQNYRLYLSRR
ncbi:MAG: hypothetical protein Q4A81_03590 [Pasteurellaceae bacterium]|nr:hypothetical protein [Pasteurellaceae bacterium]